MVPLSEALEVARVLLPAGAITATVIQTGRVVLEWVRGRSRVAEIEAERVRDVAKIEAERDTEIAKIEAAGKVEIAKLQVELQLERERNRALTSSQLSLGSPPPG